MAGTDGTAAAAEIRELLVAFHTQLLTGALAGVQKLLAAPGFAELDRSARAFVWTLGAALTLRARTNIDLAISAAKRGPRVEE